MMDEKIKKHIEAGKKLDKIKDRVFELIRKNLGKITEYDVREFILQEFKKENLIVDKNNSIPIVAVNSSAAEPHYTPGKKSKLIKKNNLILVDIWARIKKGYFADITWMGYSGSRVPRKVQETFNHVIKSRDLAVAFIKKGVKKGVGGREVDKIVRDYFKKYKIDKCFIHGTGHSLGLRECHGRFFNLNRRKNKIKTEIPFTIEPGIYYKNKFGVRSEINCYIKGNQLIITSKVQRKIVRV